MTRTYAHRPDPAWAERSYTHSAQGIDQVRHTLARDPGAHVGIVNSGVDAAWEAAAWGWLLERPTAELRAHLAAAAELVRHALSGPAGRAPELHSVERWIATALAAGDRESAVEVARRAPGQVERPGDEATHLLAALTRGDDEEATRLADALRTVLADPATPPVTAQTFERLDAIGAAVAAPDQRALEAAASARDAVVVGLHRRAAARRRWTGIVDRRALALLLLGVERGLTWPSGVASAPAELVGA